MEDRWHGPEDPTNEDLETTRKKRRGTDFLSQYLLRRKEQQGEHIEEDDDDEESEEKPKKFRRFFKGLFKRVVESPTDSKEHFPKSFSLESLFLGDDHAKSEKSTELDEDIQTPETETTFQPAETAATEAAETLEPIFVEQPKEAVEAKVTTTQQEHENSVEQPEEQAPVPLEREYIEPVVIERAIADDRTVFERAQPQPAVEKEVVIERGPGMALPVVLVGAEYLARKKADRKLDAKYNERVGRIETENKREKVAKEQLTTLVEQNREQLEALKRDRGIETPRLERHRPAEQSISRIEQQPERKLQPTPEREAAQSTSEKVTTVPETYKIMEQVAKAAEQDVPVERVFERSHEVKDDQSVPVGAVSVGAIMADQVVRQQRMQTATQQAMQDTSSLPVISDKVQAAAYKQAVQRGFWAAIIIIILGTLAYLLK
jgi:hypothetical protein